MGTPVGTPVGCFGSSSPADRGSVLFQKLSAILETKRNSQDHNRNNGGENSKANGSTPHSNDGMLPWSPTPISGLAGMEGVVPPSWPLSAASNAFYPASSLGLAQPRNHAGNDGASGFPVVSAGVSSRLGSTSTTYSSLYSPLAPTSPLGQLSSVGLAATEDTGCTLDAQTLQVKRHYEIEMSCIRLHFFLFFSYF